jgi:mono/diheme cytochrome c family protein
LGQTHIAEGVIIPFSDIYCDAIRAMLASGLIPLEPKDRDLVFGRAVGRVLAHELYHVFAKTKRHGSRGLAERAYSAEDLIAEEFRFDNGQVRKLRSTLLPNFLQLAGALSRAAPPGLSLFIESGCVGCHGAHGEGTLFGPAIRSVAKFYDSAKLTIRLNDQRTLMYGRALHLGALWPLLAEKDVQNLAPFVRSLAADSDRVTVTGAH